MSTTELNTTELSETEKAVSEKVKPASGQFDDGYYNYKSVCLFSILGIILAVFSFASLLATILMFLPVIGVVVSLLGIFKVRKFPDELTGLGLAKIALLINATLLVAVFGIYSYVYATEVPEGYQRISFSQLQPVRGESGVVPSRALALNGEKVFIKGYTYPGEKRQDLKTFVMVPDIGTCCFGGQPALTDMIEVTLDDPLRASYSMRCRKLTGILEVDDEVKPLSGLGGVYYRLKADGIK